MTEIDISIIIIAKNEQEYIGFTLDRVFKQRINKKYEVIVIDSGSKDSTLEIVRKYPVKVLEVPAQEFGHGKTRNLGVQKAYGDVVVFLNADAQPTDEYWLKNLIDNFSGNEKIAGVYSRVYPRPSCNPLRSWEILNEEDNQRQIKHIDAFHSYNMLSPGKKRRFLAFQTISCAIKRDLLLEYPFADIDFGEDLEWSKKIMENGFKIIFEPKSAVLHSHNFYYSFVKTFKKYFDDAKLNNRLLNMWSWRNMPVLAAHIIYKIVRDADYILGLDKGIFYKIGWLFYSPIIRTVEFSGIIAGINSRYLPRKLHSEFSLANEIKES
jgi:rhamnosyltransferase